MTTTSGPVTFGAFEMDLEIGRLSKSGKVVRLRPQPMRVLGFLVDRAGKPVDRKGKHQLIKLKGKVEPLYC